MAVKMKILKNHEEWLEHRKKGIGGSEIAAVIGRHPYMNNQKLFELKIGKRKSEDISENPRVKYGVDAEPLMREFFRIDFPQYEVLYEENNSFTNDKYKWALASLDGWLIEKETGRKGVLEIKTSEPIGAAQWAEWKDKLPINYYCQVIFYMAVIEADFAELTAQLKMQDGSKITRHYHIEREEVQADIDYIMQKGAEFWECVKGKREPDLLLPSLDR